MLFRSYPYRKFRKPRLGMPLNKGHRLSKGLVGCWLMNEGCGTTNADVSGNGNIGTISSATWSAGKFGSCLSFDGDGDYVDLGAKDFVGNRYSLSISGWFYVPSGEGTPSYRFFSQRYGGGNIYTVDVYWYNPYTTNLFRFVVRNSSDTLAYADGPATAKPTPGKWNHFVGVYDGINATCYINTIAGTPVALAGPTKSGSVSSMIGALASTTPANFWNGFIDNVMVYNRALSAAEIAKLYIEPFCMFEPTISPVFGSYYIPPVGNIGIMTTWGGYWGVTY